MSVMGKLCAYATVMALVGCQGPVQPDRPTGPPSAVSPLAGPAINGGVYGDPSRLDPCGLVELAAFEPFGVARAPGRPDMDDCHITVDAGEGTATVRIGSLREHRELDREERTTFADLGRGVTVEQFARGCDMVVRPGPDHAVSVTVDLPANENLSNETRCHLAYGGALGVFEVMAADEVRHWAPAPNSFAAQPACAVLADHLVSERLDVPTRPEPSLTTHSCTWRGNGTPAAELSFPVAESSTELGVTYGTPIELLGGRESWIVSKRTVCTIYTKHIAFALGEGTFEFAALRVWRWGPDDGCDVARELAAEAWAALSV